MTTTEEETARIIDLAGMRSSTPEKQPMRERLLGRSALANLPEPEPLITDTIDKRNLAVLFGPPGAGKSFVAMDMACCLATGKPWQGRIVVPGHVLYVAAEGAYGLHQRVAAWEHAWQQQIMDNRLVTLPEAVSLLSPVDVDDLVGLVPGYSFVVIDTFSRCLPGGDENSARDVTVAVEALERIKRATGDGSVLVLHHSGKDVSRGMRGHSSLSGAVDIVYHVDPDGDHLNLARSKRRDGPRDDELRLKLRAWGISCVLESSVGQPLALADLPGSQKKIIRYLAGTSSETTSNIITGADVSSSRAAEGLKALLEQGLLTRERHGNRTEWTITERGKSITER